jgi:tetratricopeptide (TPR) repeat protein
VKFYFMKYRLLGFFLFSILFYKAYTQSIVLDSLKKELLQRPGDVKVNAGLALEMAHQNPKAAFVYASTAFLNANTATNINDRAIACHALGVALERNGKADSADIIFNVGITYANQSKDYKRGAACKIGLALLNLRKSEIRIANNLLDDALALLAASKENVNRQYAQAYLYKAETYRALGIYDEGLEFAFKAKQYALLEQKPQMLSSIENAIGGINTSLHKYDVAIQAYQQAIYFAKQAKDTLNLQRFLSNIVQPFELANRFDSAEVFWQLKWHLPFYYTKMPR